MARAHVCSFWGAVVACVLVAAWPLAAAVQPSDGQVGNRAPRVDTPATRTSTDRPNVLVLLVDDLGYGDVGFLGNTTIKTPHLDALAAESINFYQAYTAAPICTPSRGAMQTGRMASRLGLTSNDSRRVLVSPAQDEGLASEEVTMAEVLKDAGYATGLLGKWHLGLGRGGRFLPTRQGYDRYWGLPLTNVQPCGRLDMVTGLDMDDPRNFVKNYAAALKLYARVTWWIWARAAMGVAVLVALFGRPIGSKRFWAIVGLFLFIMFHGFHHHQLTYSLFSPATCLLYDQEELIEQPVRLQNLTVRLVDKTRAFIAANAATQTPFLAFMSFAKVHTALFTAPERAGVSAHGAYGDNVEEMDWAVGEVMQTLRDLGVRDNTLVFFTSDHGPWLERFGEGGFAGRVQGTDGSMRKLRGGKAQVWEGGIRVPFLMSWPVRFSGGRRSATMVSTMDMFSTVADLVGGAKELLGDRPIDGRSLVPLMDGPDAGSPADDAAYSHHAEGLLFYCGRTLHAARRGRYKVMWHSPVFDDEEGQHCKSTGSLCECNGNSVHTYDPPLVFDIAADPGESHPLSPTSPEHATATQFVQEAVNAKYETYVIHPDQQPERLLALAKPSIFYTMSCCNFPSCQCCRDCDAEDSGDSTASDGASAAAKPSDGTAAVPRQDGIRVGSEL